MTDGCWLNVVDRSFARRTKVVGITCVRKVCLCCCLWRETTVFGTQGERDFTKFTSGYIVDQKGTEFMIFLKIFGLILLFSLASC